MIDSEDSVYEYPIPIFYLPCQFQCPALFLLNNYKLHYIGLRRKCVVRLL